MLWKRMNHGIGLKTHWPPQGLGQLCLSELQHETPTHTHNTCTHGFSSGFENRTSFNCFHLRSPINLFPPRRSTNATRWSRVASFSTRWVVGVATPRHNARLLSCLPQNVPRHKALILVPAHSHSTANKCDLLSFSSHYYNNKEKLNSPLPCQVK